MKKLKSGKAAAEDQVTGETLKACDDETMGKIIFQSVGQGSIMQKFIYSKHSSYWRKLQLWMLSIQTLRYHVGYLEDEEHPIKSLI